MPVSSISCYLLPTRNSDEPKIYQNDSLLKTVPTTSAFVGGLNTSTRYCYKVSAFDASNNESSQSNQSCTETYALLSFPFNVTVSPSNGNWVSSPKNVIVKCDNSNRIFYAIRSTIDGSTPTEPPEPTSSLNDGFIDGSYGIFQIYANSGQVKQLRVRFRGENNGELGPTSSAYSYSMDLKQGVAIPSNVSVLPLNGNWTSSPQDISVNCNNANHIYYTIRTTTDGSTPQEPPDPTSTLNDGSINGSNGNFQVFANVGQNKKLKVKFRGKRDGAYGPVSSTYSYAINLSNQLTPHVAQTPMSGAPGTTFAQWGTGFTPNSNATLHFKKPDGTEYTPASQAIKSDGTFSISYASEITKAPGAYSWWGVDGPTGKSSNTVNYTITANPAIAQTPMSGAPGTTFAQWGTGFMPNSNAMLHFKKPDGTEYTPTSQAIKADGTFSISYVSEKTKAPGTYTWWGVDGPSGRVSNSVSYTITQTVIPAISQTPTSGPGGTTFQQSGSGFSPNSTATLHFRKPDGTEYTPASQPINSNGTFSISYSSETTKAPGTYSWWGVDGPTGKVSNSISYTITVKPTIAQTPMSGPAGTTFAQWGTGFTPNSTATLHFRKPDGTEYPTSYQSIDGNGTFSTSYPSPTNKPTGTYTWWGVDGPTGKPSNTVSYTIK